jgi:adenylate cyclase
MTRSVQTPPDSAALIDSLADWLIAQALDETDLESLLAGCCERLRSAGLPLWRGFIALQTLHPLIRTVALTWHPGSALEREEYLHADGLRGWEESPFRHMVESEKRVLRRHLTGDDAGVDFPILRELRDKGACDYLAYIVPFGRHDFTDPRSEGIVGSWATDRASGFTDHEIDTLRRIENRLGVACQATINAEITANVLNAYLGKKAAQQVLAGQIRRGDGEMIHAVIWYTDMRNSTRMADVLPAGEFLQALNGYFECSAGAVLDHGGEVLRFVGDAVLAIFAIEGDETAVRSACEHALAAAKEAQVRIAALNRNRAKAGQPPLAFGLSLHIGDVMYGNIGTPARIEYSVVGRAANEAARLENLTKTLRRPILASGDFARHLPGSWESLGNHQLQGVEEPVEVFTPVS